MPCLDETSGGCQKLQWLLWWQLTWVRRASPASRHRSDHPRADPLSRYPGLLEIEKKWGGRSFQYLRDLQASLGLFAGSPGCATSTYARPFAEAAQHAKRALLGTPFAVNVLFERRAYVSSVMLCVDAASYCGPSPSVNSLEAWSFKNTMPAVQTLLLAATAHGVLPRATACYPRTHGCNATPSIDRLRLLCDGRVRCETCCQSCESSTDVCCACRHRARPHC